MGLGDKFKNKAQEASGKVKESVGDATNNEDLQAEGVKDQAAAKAKQAGEAVKDAAKDVRDDFNK
ncbi:CsbD family protein [Glutamicibacter mishrai]|uniref:CsbD family protein n=1 Tax=Glutamicibacter mishrai TaxID=1775880 RepID=A0A6H0SQ04_9MICC|nr:CsbD family protein [Glutamicibacter mishrai]QIV88425.1 CsbD family protein [Glutamicibacter mishrai]UTT41191.1 CsbD family protein [Glutamicibacter mishrai]